MKKLPVSRTQKKSNFPSSGSHQLPIVFTWGRGLRSSIPIHAGMFTCLDLLQGTAVGGSACVQQPCRAQNTFHNTPSHSLALTFSCPVFCNVPWFLEGGGDVDVPSIDDHWITYFQHFEQLGVCTLTVIHCNKKLLWLRLSASQNNGYKYKYLGDNLIMCLLGKTMVVSFSLRPMTFWAMGVWPSAYSIRDEFFPVEQPLNLIWMQFVICTTGIPLFHPYTYLSWQISSAVAFRIHCWVRPLMSSLRWKTAQHPLTPWKLASNGRVSWLWKSLRLITS